MSRILIVGMMMLALVLSGCARERATQREAGPVVSEPLEPVQPAPAQKTYRYEHRIVTPAEDLELADNTVADLRDWYNKQGSPPVVVLLFAGNQALTQGSQVKSPALRLWTPLRGEQFFISNATLRNAQDAITNSLVSIGFGVQAPDTTSLQRIDEAVGNIEGGLAVDVAKIRPFLPSQKSLLLVNEVSRDGDYLRMNQRLINTANNQLLAATDSYDDYLDLQDPKARADWMNQVVRKNTNALLRRLVR